MSQKKNKKFYCKKCDYTSRNKYDFTKHLSTLKHNNDNKMVTKVSENGNKSPQYFCTDCGKKYKFPEN